jgi:hypothetical protein
MSLDHVIVEINRKPAGILSCLDEEVQFFASSPAAFALDRRVFGSVREAITAVAEAMAAHGER